MKTIFRGEINDFVPFIKASINDGMLAITDDGNLSMTVDTGFSGGIALPLKLIKRLGLEQVVYDRFQLGTGKFVDLPVFLGKVIVKNKAIETWFIPGDSLIGMEFLYSIGSALNFDLKKDVVKLAK
jgi:predicted aspartyl protease